MAQYPFDQDFKNTVSKLFPYWGNYQKFRDQMFEEFAEAGYSVEEVTANIEALLNLPTGALIELALADLAEDSDDSPALLVLQGSTARDVFDCATNLCTSHDSVKRELGVSILMRTPGRTYHDEAVSIVTDLAARETDETVMEVLAYALLHLDVEHCLDFLMRAAASSASGTREAAAYSLGHVSEESVIETKIMLTRDADDEVRNWATFGLHSSLDNMQLNRKDIRDALFERVTDEHEETSYEAIEGLAKCGDMRVLKPLIMALESEEVWDTAVEAAKVMAHPALLPSLIDLKKWWDSPMHPNVLDEAIASCSPQSSE